MLGLQGQVAQPSALPNGPGKVPNNNNDQLTEKLIRELCLQAELPKQHSRLPPRYF